MTKKLSVHELNFLYFFPRSPTPLPPSHGQLFPSEKATSGAEPAPAQSSSKTEISVASSRSSIKQLYDIISSFDDHKKQLVQSIGFGGLLMFPALRQINRRFAAWIMSRVDPLSQTLVIEPSKQISFNKDDVERVLGIQSQGKSVLSLGAPSKQLVNKVSDMYLQGRDKDRRSVKVAQDVIERNYPEGMTEADINAFKVAFVIYVMSTLLSPGSKHDYISIDYWNALSDPTAITRAAGLFWGDTAHICYNNYSPDASQDRNS
ncbi:hypothetical protein PVAP13_2NG633501 [Panicum virgatum]|uniref:Uncharacterized protein n=1 Tax=Panicum virgatum TaxID=38727 RepID=A0A8T0VW69_PANVG|nr:hypothetical protein PVAP13_2NG633501 [Panicum virgatum]